MSLKRSSRGRKRPTPARKSKAKPKSKSKGKTSRSPKKKKTQKQKRKVVKRKPTKKKVSKKSKKAVVRKARSQSKRKASVKKSPKLRVAGKNVKLSGNIDVKKALKDLDAKKVETLTIGTADDDHFAEEEFVFDMKMPKLKKLVLMRTMIKKLKLTDALVPKLRTLIIEGCSESGLDLDVKHSKIEEVQLDYLSDSITKPNALQKMLSVAKHLKFFRSYKTVFPSDVVFASDKLQGVVCQRADLLVGVKVYSPVLQSLDLCYCHELEIVEVPVVYRGFKKVAQKKLSKFEVAVDGHHADLIIRDLASTGRLKGGPAQYFDGDSEFGMHDSVSDGDGASIS